MRKSSKRRAGMVLSFLFATVAHAVAEAGQVENALHELVAVSIVRDGRAIVLATPGVPAKGRSWRFRSLDTSALPQPIRSVSLSSSGTKLFIQFGNGPGGVLDLTRQYRYHVPLQRVTLGDLAIDGRTPPQSHRLPGQRFVSLHNGMAYVVDDGGRRLPSTPARHDRLRHATLLSSRRRRSARAMRQAEGGPGHRCAHTLP